jgi:hypothetical protein
MYDEVIARVNLSADRVREAAAEIILAIARSTGRAPEHGLDPECGRQSGGGCTREGSHFCLWECPNDFGEDL